MLDVTRMTNKPAPLQHPEHQIRRSLRVEYSRQVGVSSVCLPILVEHTVRNIYVVQYA